MVQPQDVDQFVNALYPEDKVLQQVRANCIKAGLPDIAVSDQQARFLTLLVQITGATRILEVGTLGGLSTIAMARGTAGIVDTLEVDGQHAQVANKNFREANLSNAINLHIGDAKEVMRDLAADVSAGIKRPYDFVFIDADKESNFEYFNLALELCEYGSVILVDNVVREGRCLTVEDKVAFLEAVATQYCADTCIVQTVGDKVWDGFVLARVTV